MNAVDAPARPFTQRLLNLLRLFDGCRGNIAVEGRSLSGIGAFSLELRPPTLAVPFQLLDAIRDGWGCRVGPVTRDGGHLQDLAAAFVVWRPVVQFDRASNWRYTIAPEAQAVIREALAGFPLAPALLIVAGPEVVGLWRLDRPLAVDRDPAHAAALLVELAARLGADGEPARDLAVRLPLCGPIRNWNEDVNDLVDIVDVEPARCYRVEDLEAGLITTTESRPAHDAGARKKGSRP